MNRFILIGLGVFFSLIAFSQKEVKLDETIINKTKEKRLRDSIEFEQSFKELMTSTDISDLKVDCDYIDRPKYYIWLRKHSDDIIRKLHPLYNRYPSFEPLLALTNLPDSVKQDILRKKHETLLGRARLGDSLAISKYVNQYKQIRDVKPNPQGYCVGFQHEWMASLIGKILSFNKPELTKMVFNDMESTRIYIDPNNSQGTVYYTIPYAVVAALKNRFPEEPLFNDDYLAQFFNAYSPDDVNPRIRKFYKQVEAFIWDKYKINVNIKVPFLEAGWKDYGCFWGEE